MTQLSFHSPVGDLTLSAENDEIVSLDWGWSPLSTETAFLKLGKSLLDAYFDGKNPDFNLAINCSGTRFQQRVWQALNKIPCGKTMTYGEIAQIVNSHPRAIGSACRLNPVPIIIPCHRVTAKDGALTGYSGGAGIKTKKFLIDLEEYTR